MHVTARELHGLIRDTQELALLDVREEGDFGGCHLLLAVNVPMSACELRIASLVPQPQVRTVVCDGDGGELALRGAERLRQLGYADVRVLEGGTAAWQAAGYEVYSGVNVASKAFGEYIEHACGTPSISAEELKARMDSGEDMVVVDSRPLSEYQAMNIPGSTCVPGGELVYRIGAIAPRPDTQVVVNCAGRTRSIIGAQSLINAAIPNPVTALRNGTMGWHLAGEELEHGQARYLAPLTASIEQGARRLAAEVAERFEIRSVNLDTVQQWRKDPTRTTYVLDVRTPEEFEDSHLEGAVSAPGGQLIQASDRYIGVLGSRVVLIDDDQVRAVMAASWLTQMNLHEVYVLRSASGSAAESGPGRPLVRGLDQAVATPISAAELHPVVENGGVLILDLSPSLDFRAGHIPGALHAVRGHLDERLSQADAHDLLVLCCGDGLRSRFAAAEAAGLTGAPVKVLEGGTRAWREAGRALDTGRDGLEAMPRDTYLRPYDHDESIEQHMQSYLDWEIELVDRIARDDTVSFRTVHRT